MFVVTVVAEIIPKEIESYMVSRPCSYNFYIRKLIILILTMLTLIVFMRCLL